MTQTIHPTWELPVLAGKATLVLTPCPGTKDPNLTDSLKQLKTQGVTAIVTALNVNEMTQAGVATLPEQTKALGINWFHLPIEDDCAPDDKFTTQWEKISPELHKALNKGEKITFHCMGGSGRTGMLAAHLLLELGWDLDTIKKEVKALRPGAFTKPLQIEYIDQFVAKNEYRKK